MLNMLAKCILFSISGDIHSFIHRPKGDALLFCSSQAWHALSRPRLSLTSLSEINERLKNCSFKVPAANDDILFLQAIFIYGFCYFFFFPLSDLHSPLG